MTTLVHATCVALRLPGRTWRAVLLRGASGAGKSDLALRLIDAGGRLVADDQTRIARRGRTLTASAPTVLAGLIEVRGVGIARGPLAMIVDLVPPEHVERLPDPAEEEVLGVALPLLALAPFEASAPAKLRLALARTAAA